MSESQRPGASRAAPAAGPAGLLSGRRRQMTALAAITALFFTLAGLYFVNLLRWSCGPDFGMHFTDQIDGLVVSEVHGPAEKAGLRPGDVILEVNGAQVASLTELRDAINRGIPGENSYKIRRSGQVHELTVSNTPLGVRTTCTRYGLTLLLGIVFFLIGAIVFFMKPGTHSSWVFLITLFNGGLYIVFSFTSKLSPAWLGSVTMFSAAFLSANILHLALIFPVERSWVQDRKLWIWVPYGISLALFVLMQSSARVFADAPPFYRMATDLYRMFAIVVFLGSTLFNCLRSTSSIARIRSKVILLGSTLALVVPVLDVFSNYLFQIILLPSAVFFLPFYVYIPLSIGYAIVKHNLFDVDTYIKRAVGYGIMTVLVGAAYLLLEISMRSLVLQPLLGGYSERLFPIVFSFLVVFFFNPVRNRLQRFIDRVFYRLEYDYQETVRGIGESMRSLLTRDQIVESMMDIAFGTMFIDSGCVLLLDRQRQAFQVVASRGEGSLSSKAAGDRPGPQAVKARADAGAAAAGHPREEDASCMSTPVTESGVGDADFEITVPLIPTRIPVSEPPLASMAALKTELTLYDVLEDPAYEGEREASRELFESLGATLLVPLVTKDNLVGVMALGTKKSGRFYRREDIDLLKTLSFQSAVAIENALLLDEVIEKERMEEELAIARDLQMSMLPAACPRIEGFDIAAISTPAREVGGDFYDFIQVGRGKLGLVVGDVTGKSVSGALVVAASRSVFRMLSEQGLDLSEMMNRANQRIKKDIKSGMFVALLYASFEANSQMLRLSSAGQTQPLHLSARDGTVRLIETEGDTFPLGILDDVEYLETCVELGPGDKVVFYTDGIVEAMNGRNEIFGFERLMETVKQSRSMDAESLLREILVRVNAFTGDTPVHDDLTIIVVNALS